MVLLAINCHVYCERLRFMTGGENLFAGQLSQELMSRNDVHAPFLSWFCLIESNEYHHMS